MTMISVAIYFVDRCYGGSEEGGWWYDAGDPVVEEVPLVPSAYQLPRYFYDEDEAIAHRDQLQELLDVGPNKGRRHISSVLSSGVYRAVVMDGHPRHFPERRPHYE